MMQIEADIVPLLLAASTGGMRAREFAQLLPVDANPKPAVTVVMAAPGYPGTPEKGSTIRNLHHAGHGKNVMIFHAGTALDADGNFIANGGRVLNVTATGETLREAVDRAYAAIGQIDWPEGVYRRDIGWRGL